MVTEIKMPKMGLTMMEGTINRWLKKEGDSVEEGETLLEIATGKVDADVESPAQGVLLKILAGEGRVIPVGEALALVGEQGEDLSEFLAKDTKSQETAHEAKSEAIQSPETDTDTSVEGPAVKVRISPRARKLAQEYNLDCSEIQGTGPQGRITEKDVENFMEKKKTTAPVKMSPTARKLAEENQIPEDELALLDTKRRVMKEDILNMLSAAEQEKSVNVPFSEIRKVTAERMAYNAHTAAQVTLTTEADMTETVKLRQRLIPHVEKETGLRLSYTEILVAVVARALKEFPNMNSQLQKDSMECLPQINIGVAVDTSQGLLVPVIPRADSLTLSQICQTVKAQVEKARQGKLKLHELEGGTFTITNLGMFEIDSFTPIINLPEAAILGVGRLVEKPAIYQGEIASRWLMFLSLTFDHRLVDGAPAAKFLQRIKKLLENPFLLLT